MRSRLVHGLWWVTTRCVSCRGAYKPIPDGYSDDLKRLVAALLQKDPRARPVAAAILAQPYVRRHVQVPKTSVEPSVLAECTSTTPGCKMIQV